MFNETDELFWWFKMHCYLTCFSVLQYNVMKDTQYISPDNLGKSERTAVELVLSFLPGHFLSLRLAKLPFADYQKFTVYFAQKENYGVTYVLVLKWMFAQECSAGSCGLLKGEHTVEEETSGLS